MHRELAILVQNLQTSFEGKPWYGTAVMKKLNEIPWTIVNEPIYGAKTIAVLVRHIINWRIFVLEKLNGNETFNIVIDGENDWDLVAISTEEEWNALKQQLQDTQENLVTRLAQENDDLLERQVPGKTYSFGPILTSIAQHDVYHLGQIAMLNAMRKS